ncbi:conidia-enriched transcript [Histoplasma ohiense]
MSSRAHMQVTKCANGSVCQTRFSINLSGFHFITPKQSFACSVANRKKLVRPATQDLVLATDAVCSTRNVGKAHNRQENTT